MNRVYILTGQTAIGKTGIGRLVAKQLGAKTIINGDSSTIIKGLPILTNFEAPQEFEMFPKQYDAQSLVTFHEYKVAVRQKITEMHQRGEPVLIEGGSWYYLKSIFSDLLTYEDTDLFQECKNELAVERKIKTTR